MIWRFKTGGQWREMPTQEFGAWSTVHKRERVRRALKHGVPVARGAEFTGLSRERTYQIRDGRR